MRYVLGIDQSTQGTKAVLADEYGKIAGRADRAHRQIINGQGWVSHDLNEIYENVLAAARAVLDETDILPEQVAAIGISNQRETTAIWDRNGAPLTHAVVWQCARAEGTARSLSAYSEIIRDKTGLKLSPYFPAAKMAWLIQNLDIQEDDLGQICLGTIDSWLIFRMTGGASFKTDYSNASRTQLYSIRDLKWDEEICGLSAPYWKADAKAVLYGMSRTTGKNEIIKAALESIAYQINAVLESMEKDSGIPIRELRVDGGPTRNSYLMQLQSDLSNVVVQIANTEELSAIGAAYLAGLGAGIYEKAALFGREERKQYVPAMKAEQRKEKLADWNHVIDLLSR